MSSVLKDLPEGINVDYAKILEANIDAWTNADREREAAYIIEFLKKHDIQPGDFFQTENGE